ncbi:MAG: GntR family transcriptional regulator [Pusillimonas sp.]
MTAIRYTEIAAVLARRIAEERYPIGSFMPTEKELTQEFNASRHTVRAALRQLQDARLVSRRRGSGTMVEAKTSNSGFGQSLSSLEDLVLLAASSPRQLMAVKEVVADLEMAQLLNIGPGTRWIRFTSTRASVQNEPIVLTDVYVDAQYGAIKKIVQQSPDRLISELIEEYYGLRIVSVKQDITACALPPAAAKALKTAPNAPGLFIARQYRDAAQALVVVSSSYHPAGKYKFSTMLIRQK